MSEIEEAQVILKRWRATATAGNWVAGEGDQRDLIWKPQHPGYHPALAAVEEGDTALIVGTAGNPELLDALEGLLWRGTVTESSIVLMYADLIATAIIKADQGMTK